jgi:hypothetical protein
MIFTWKNGFEKTKRILRQEWLVQHGDPVIIRHPTVVLFAVPRRHRWVDPMGNPVEIPWKSHQHAPT